MMNTSNATNPTIGRLFELLLEAPLRSDTEIASVLGLDLVHLRARLVDLRKRGILAGPFEDAGKATWKPWFSTSVAMTDALERSGLRITHSVVLPKTWWDGMWAN